VALPDGSVATGTNCQSDEKSALHSRLGSGFGPTKGAPWRAGANESTAITLSHDVKVEGKDLKAGTYALFLDVEQTGPWNWVFSRHLGWGSFQYDPKDDVLRVAVMPQDAPFTEFLTYGFDEQKPDSAIAYAVVTILNQIYEEDFLEPIS
jgi:DUF2911 family protein